MVSILSRRNCTEPVMLYRRGAMPKVELLVLAAAVEGKSSELKKEFQAMLSPTHAESGCEFYRLYESKTAGHFFLHELWTNQNALEEHRKTPHFLHFKQAIEPLLDRPLDVHRVQELTPA